MVQVNVSAIFPSRNNILEMNVLLLNFTTGLRPPVTFLSPEGGIFLFFPSKADSETEWTLAHRDVTQLHVKVP